MKTITHSQMMGELIMLKKQLKENGKLHSFVSIANGTLFCRTYVTKIIQDGEGRMEDYFIIQKYMLDLLAEDKEA
jgi:hypothetical protein